MASPLRIAALMMPTEHRDDFLTSFTGGQRELVDYMASDVLDVLPEERRQFLLEVSVLGRMCGPLCDAVTENGAPATVLADLERSSLCDGDRSRHRCAGRHSHRATAREPGAADGGGRPAGHLPAEDRPP